MTIKMAHGSGGKETAELIDQIFGKYFQNEILSQKGDAALFEISGKIAMTTDSFVVTPIFFPGGDIGKLAVCGTVNDLLMEGAVPRYITTAFILEEGLPIEDLEKIVSSMAQAANEAGVIVVAGDTKVIEGHGGMYINTTGIGVIPPDRSLCKGQYAEGDAIILSGTLGDHHSCILSQRMGIENDIRTDAQPLGTPVLKMMNEGIKIKAMRDVTRGGLGTVLNELLEKCEYGAIIEKEQLPVTEAVAGLCDILGLDPLYMGNEGKFVVIVEGSDRQKTLNLLRETDEAKEAAIIGYVHKQKGIMLCNAFGGKRAIDVLYGEGLPRIC